MMNINTPGFKSFITLQDLNSAAGKRNNFSSEGRVLSFNSLILFFVGMLFFIVAPLQFAYAKRIDVYAMQEINGQHYDDYVYMTEGKLTIDENTVLGNKNLYSRFDGGHVTVGSGVIMRGENLFHGHASADIAVGARQQAQLGFVTFHQDTVVHFDNVSVAGFAEHERYGATEALQLNDNAVVTLSANTRIESVSPLSDAINMFDNSTLTANGSYIQGRQDAIRMTGSTGLRLNGVTVRGDASGIAASDNARVDITGGSITSEGLRHTGDVPAAAVVAGGSAFIAAPAGVNLNVHDADVLGKGRDEAGIAAGSVKGSQTHVSIFNSRVSGQRNGVRLFLPGAVASKTTELQASHAAIRGNRDAAITVDDAVRTAITLTRGTTLDGGDGNALTAGRSSQVQLRVANSAINGNILNNGGDVSVSLADRARWHGKANQLTSVNLAPGTAWQFTAPSRITKLVNNGLIVLSDATSTRNTVSVEDYEGNGGEVLFNSSLAGDTSPSDKLVILKNSRGTSSVSVSNLGGSGSQTINGIELIHVQGNAQATFIQKGRITAGLYDYALEHNSDGSSWFLTSQKVYQDRNTPSVRVVRPESGSYIANLDAARRMFVMQWRDRSGETRYVNPVTGQMELSHLWLRQVYRHRRFSDSDGQVRTRDKSYVVQLGGDIVQSDPDSSHGGHLGLMGGYGSSTNHSRSSLSSYRSHGEVKGYNLGLYGTWQADNQTNTGAYFDSWAGYSWFRQDVQGQNIEAERSDLSGVTASLESGYTLAAARTDLTNIFLEPSVQIVRLGVNGADITEHNGTRVNNKEHADYQTRAGIRIFARNEDQSGAADFSPFLELNWIHHTAAPGVRMDGERAEQVGTKNVAEGLMGGEGHLTEALALQGHIGLQAGEKDFRDLSALIGVKYAF